MQSTLCSRVLRTSLARQRPRPSTNGQLSDFRRYSGHPGSEKKYPALDEILGKPAVTFEQLVDQLETLIKHPSPPRNYADALVKEEMRRMDHRDLSSSDFLKQNSEKDKVILRQRPRIFRHSRLLVERNARGNAPDDMVTDPPVVEHAAANLGITPEQQEQRRIWTTKIKGYKAFRKNMVSMDSLLDSLEVDDEPTMHEEFPFSGNESKVMDRDMADEKEAGRIAEDDAEFERLIRESWRIYDKDLASVDAGDGGNVDAGQVGDGQSSPEHGGRQGPAGAGGRFGPGGRGPSGTRSFHTTRRVVDSGNYPFNSGTGKPANGAPRPQTTTRIISSNTRLTKSKRIDSNRKRMEKAHSHSFKMPKEGMFLKPKMPSKEQVKKHIREGKKNYEDEDIPIDASARIGDVVDIRYESAQLQSSPLAINVFLGGVIQKVTGRFHFNVIQLDGVFVGSRETRLGFVAKGLLFNAEFLRSCGIKESDVTRITEYGRELELYEAEHGVEAISNAQESNRLQELQRQVYQQINMRGSPGGTNTFKLAEDVSQDELAPLPILEKPAPAAREPASDEDTGDTKEESIEEVLLRVVPLALRSYRQKAERLQRSRFRELDSYWKSALNHDKTSVTVEELAELIFGDGGKNPIGEVERLATYMHLISNPIHYIPDPDFLFVTNRFHLRSEASTRKFEKTRDMVRSNSPEFRSFIHKARQLIAYSNARAPTSPQRSSLSPDLESHRKSMYCSLTDWNPDVEVMVRPPMTEPILTEEEVDAMEFDASDKLFINALQNYVFERGPGYKGYATPFESIVPPIMKKMKFYTGCSTNTVVQFLVDIGFWPSWFNPANNTREIPYGTLSANKKHFLRKNLADELFELYAKKKRALRAGNHAEAAMVDTKMKQLKNNIPDDLFQPVDDSILTRKPSEDPRQVSIMDKTELYDRDICEDIRHDFGNMKVYTIDDEGTKDVDDGVSLEKVVTASGEEQSWIHIHVADPTAIIHPGSIIGQKAQRVVRSVYLADGVSSMLSGPAANELVSLVRRENNEPVNTMTFSALIGADGDIVDYKVRPGLIRNITATSYDLLSRYLSYENIHGPTSSFADLQRSMRQSEMIHPFVPSDQEMKLYGEMDTELPDVDAKVLLEIQEIARRHYEYRVRNKAFVLQSPTAELDLGVDSLPLPRYSSSRPSFLHKPFNLPQFGDMIYPKIRMYCGKMNENPAKFMVSELMIVAGRAAARFAVEHGTDSNGVITANSKGVLTGGRGMPFFFRTQALPNLEALAGVVEGMPHSFDELTDEQARSAKNLYDCLIARAMKNGGYIEEKIYDEVRHMMSPSFLTTTPGPHMMMGISDVYGYTRSTSPIRRVEDMICQWQIKAQLLAERSGSGKEKMPWYWGHDELAKLASPVFRMAFKAEKLGYDNTAYWAYVLIRRMESDARYGRLQMPPEGFYDTNSPSYYDLPWAYYNPNKPGPLIWTAIVDNRDETRPFISVRIGPLYALACLFPRPVDRTQLPPAGTKIRVQVVIVSPHDKLAVVRLAPEWCQPPGLHKYWKYPKAMALFTSHQHIAGVPPANMGTDIASGN
ncbi:3'-5' RNA exonuclease complex component [Coemansia sp. Benny D115]|nr:3'-5' RNA exonuclease complex component [Coemansia sp. Benny D115]